MTGVPQQARVRLWFPSWFGVVLAMLVATIAPAAASELPVAESCAVVDIDGIGWQRLSALQAASGVDWWLEFDQVLVSCGSKDAVAALGQSYRVIRFHRPSAPDRLRLARSLTPDVILELGATVIARGGAWALLDFEHLEPPPLEPPADAPGGRLILEVTANTVLARQSANQPPRQHLVFDGRVGVLLDEIDRLRWFDDIVTLASYNRYTFSPDIDNARDWLVQQFQAMPGLVVTTPQFDVWGEPAYNVVATMTGTVQPDDWYIVGGHYDATSEDPYVAAPGAEDNASGCAGVLELARIFTAYPPEGTMLFICYSGEEQYLYGSTDHASDLVASGDAAKVRAMLDMDMIGYTSDADLDCVLESAPFAQWLIDVFDDAATEFTTLRIVESTSPGGSDHVPYLDRGMPALLTIENDFWDYPYYHTTLDLPQNIVLDMGEQILRMNVAAMAGLMGVNPELLFGDGFESGDVSAWSTAIY